MTVLQKCKAGHVRKYGESTLVVTRVPNPNPEEDIKPLVMITDADTGATTLWRTGGKRVRCIKAYEGDRA